MIKEIIDKLVALLAVSALLASCSESELWQNPQTEARDGYIMLNFKTEIPAMQEVVTRAVDPDGGGVQDMTLFCFDSYGLFISTVKAGSVMFSCFGMNCSTMRASACSLC